MLLARRLASVAARRAAMRRVPSDLTDNGPAQDANSTILGSIAARRWVYRFTPCKGLRVGQWLDHHMVHT